MATETWILYDLDVWGNEDDGFEVNDWWAVKNLEFTEMEIQDDQAILNRLKEEGCLATSDPKYVEVVADYGFIQINVRDTGRPLYNLEHTRR